MCFSHGFVWIKQNKVKEKGTIGKPDYMLNLHMLSLKHRTKKERKREEEKCEA